MATAASVLYIFRDSGIYYDAGHIPGFVTTPGYIPGFIKTPGIYSGICYDSGDIILWPLAASTTGRLLGSLTGKIPKRIEREVGRYEQSERFRFARVRTLYSAQCGACKLVFYTSSRCARIDTVYCGIGVLALGAQVIFSWRPTRLLPL